MLDGLTPRQREIVALIEQGCSNKEIAAQLDIGVGTVKQHVAALFRRLNVTSRAQAVAVLRGLSNHDERERHSAAPETSPAKGPHGQDVAALAAECRVLSVAALLLESAESLAQTQGTRRLMETLDSLTSFGRQAAEQFGGQCFERLGLGIELRFGFAKARGDDAARAVRATRYVIERLTAADGEPLLRAGVATGVGVILAQGSQTRPLASAEMGHAWRLAHGAPNGRILACEATQRLTSSSLGYDAAHSGQGLGRAAAVKCEILSQPPAFLPQPRRRLLDHLQQLAGNAPALAVEAAVGQGRTALAAALTARLEAADYLVLYLPAGRITSGADPLGLSAGFEIKSGLGYDIAPGLRPAKFDAFLSGEGFTNPAIRHPLLALMTPDGGPSDPAALLAALKAMSESKRLALIVDDAEQAPPPLVELLAAAQTQGRGRIGVFLFATPLPPGVDAKFAKLDHHVIPPLSEDDMAALIREIDTERLLDEGLARAVIRQAQGRPGDGVELVQALLSRIRIKGEGAPPQGLPMPLKLYAALIGEMDVDPDVREALRLSSLLGRFFAPALLSRFWPKGHKSLEDALARAVKAGLLIQEGSAGTTRYAFSRPMLREAAALSWLSADRSKLKGRIERTRVRVGVVPLAPSGEATGIRQT